MSKNLKYYKENAEQDYLFTPISVLRYITELENKNEISYLEGARDYCKSSDGIDTFIENFKNK